MAERTVAQAVKDLVGVTPIVEGTGGGCEALVALLPGGRHLVVCSNLSVPVWGDEDVSVGIYSPGAWDNGGDAAGEAWGEWEPLTLPMLTDLVGVALRDAQPTTRRVAGRA